MLFPNRITQINPSDKVLEIGPGSLPHPRADVYLDKKFDEKTAYKQRGLTEKLDFKKEFIEYDGTCFPFKDKEFDYVICSHVIEHIPQNELSLFISEIERVSSKGYIELPSIYYEYLFNFYVHEWVANFRDNKLLLLHKSKVPFSKVNDSFYLMKKIGFKKTKNQLIEDFKEFFIIGFEWSGSVPYEIVTDLDELINEKDVEKSREYFNIYPATNKLKSKGIKELSALFLQKIYTKFLTLNKNQKLPNWFKNDLIILKSQETINTKRFELSDQDILPILNQKNKITGFDRHYIYHINWAIRILYNLKPVEHIDISSSLNFSTVLSTFLNVKFYDFHPVNIQLPDLSVGTQDLKKLTFESSSIHSLSCMHVIEHIGLGRYGDEIDYEGDLKAISELKRVIAKKGNLFIVIPIGKPAIIFNAHRIYSHNQILNLFHEFELKDFTLIPDDETDGHLVKNPSQFLIDKQKYGCGCYWFIKN